MQKASFLKILLLLVIPLSAKELNDSIINAFLDDMDHQVYASSIISNIHWELFPLTKFPYLKGESFPWTLTCAGHYKAYKTIDNVVCFDDETIFIGSKAYFQDSYLYRAGKYHYTRCFWLFLEEHIILVNNLGVIMKIFYRTDLDSNFKETPILYPE